MAPVRLAAAGLTFAVLLALAAFAFHPARASASGVEVVSLADGTTVALSTPPFLVKGKRYAFTWPGGGPPQTFTVKEMRKDGWILVEVAEENVDPNLVPFGTLPNRWLNVGIATSIQEMRPLIQ
jgi:hypothetical protein